MKKFLSAALIAGSAFALTAVPASAHVNDNVVKANDAREARQGGTPFKGFVGPVEGFVGSDTYVTAHSGMECGALRNPNMTALGPAGANVDPRFICPSADNLKD
jgi:hypothetical protein